jgi:hypothetical protein
MKYCHLIPILALFLAGAVVAEEPEERETTYQDAGETFKEGGREIGEGFRGLGRGLKETFTGNEAREEYKETKKIGEGFKDIGRGVGKGAGATGNAFEEGLDGEE